MNRYQLTVRLPNGSGWRIRTTSAATLTDITRSLTDAAGHRVQFAELQTLWPNGTVANWSAYAATICGVLIEVVASAVRAGQYDILQSGRGLLTAVLSRMQHTDWKDHSCTAVGKRMVKILLSLGLAYLRAQFPHISAANSTRAIAVLDGLLSQRS